MTPKNIRNPTKHKAAVHIAAKWLPNNRSAEKLHFKAVHAEWCSTPLSISYMALPIFMDSSETTKATSIQNNTAKGIRSSVDV